MGFIKSPFEAQSMKKISVHKSVFGTRLNVSVSPFVMDHAYIRGLVI